MNTNLSHSTIQNYQWPKDTFVCIPAYNAADDLEITLPKFLTKIPGSNLCIVDDGSSDTTGSLCAAYPVEYLKHDSNRGKGAALRTGFSHLLQKDAQWIITMDADGQHAVRDIPKFTRTAGAYPDSGIIIGVRNMSIKAMPPARIFSNTVTSTILTLMCGCRIRDSQCGFRIYSAALLKKVTLCYNRFEMESEVILRACAAGFPVRFIPVQTLYCSTQSHISHLKDMFRWMQAVIRVWLETRGFKKNTRL